MADPVVINCPADVWTLVATGLTDGTIHIISNEPDAYYQTHRDTLTAAPTDLSDAITFKSQLTIRSTPVDMYVQPAGKDGVVRVEPIILEVK